MSTNMEHVFRIGKGQSIVLPAGYTQLEYIESTGTQYIDIPFTFNNTDEMRAEVAITDTAITDRYFIAPISWNTNDNRFTLGGFHVNPTIGFNYAYGASLTVNTQYVTGQDNDFHIYHYINKTFSMVDLGIVKDVSAISWGGETATLRIFYSYAYPIKCKIKNIWHKRSNNYLYNLVPAKRKSDNVIGMYDLVSQTFFTNAGTGNFTAGPVVEVTKISQNNQTIWERAISLESDKDSEVTFRSTRNESKNLFDKNKSWQIGSTYANYQYQTSDTQCYIKLFDNDTSVDLSGIYFGIKHELTSSSSGVWLVTSGNVVSTGATNIVNNEYSNYLITFPNNQATVDKVLQRFKIMVVEGSTATSYQPYWNTLPELNAYGNTAQPSAIKPYVKTAISTTPTAFNSELAGPLNVLADGKTEQRNIPAEYQELEYISSNSKAYIDTGIAGGKTTLEIGAKFSYSSFVAYGAIYGNYVSDSHQGIRCILAAGSGKIIVNNETICTTTGNTELYCSMNNVHTLISKNTEIILDGTTTVITYTTQGDTNTGNIAVLNRSITNPNTSRNVDAKVYEFYIKDNGILVCNLIPAKRLSDSVIGMYDTVSGTFFTNAGTGTFTAGPVKTPTPDTPIDIVCNNGVIKYGQYGKNLFDMSSGNIKLGYYIDNKGTEQTASSNFYNTKYIPVAGGKTYTLGLSSPITYTSVMEYDNNKTFVKRTLYGTGSAHKISSATITLDSSTAFVLIGSNVTGKSGSTLTLEEILAIDWQFEEGDTVTAFEPYHFGLHVDGTQEKITTANNCGVVDLGTLNWTYQSGYQYFNSTSLAGIIKNASNWVEKAHLYCSLYTTTHPDDIYGSSGTHGDRLVTVTPAGAVCITNRTYTDAASFKQAMSGVYLYYQRTTDETFTAPVISNVEMLNKIGDYKDVQDVVNGSVTKNIGIKVLDGTESWSYSSTIVSEHQTFSLSINDSNKDNNFIPLSNSYIGLNAATPFVSMQNNQFKHGLNSNTYYFIDDRFDNVNGFKAYLADQYAKGTPVIILYSLETPTTSTVTAQPITQAVGTNIATISEGSITSLVGEVSGINQTQTTPIPESPLDIVSNNGVIKYGQYGKNLFDYANCGFINGKFISDTGEIVSTDGIGYTDSYTPVKPNTTYTWSGKDGTSSSSNYSICEYAADKTFISRGYRHSSTVDDTFTTGANTYYLRFNLQATDTRTTLQLEEGSTATSYESYHFGLHVDGTQEKITVSDSNNNSQTVLAEMLNKVGNYQDIQNIVNGSVSKNIGIKVLDGTETWSINSAKRAYCNVDNMMLQHALDFKCSHFKTGTPQTENLTCQGGTNYAVAYFRYDGYTDVNDATNWKAYLAEQYAKGTPVIVVYPLATPTTESVVAQDIDINKGTYTAEVTEASLDDLDISVKYLGNE